MAFIRRQRGQRNQNQFFQVVVGGVFSVPVFPLAAATRLRTPSLACAAALVVRASSSCISCSALEDVDELAFAELKHFLYRELIFSPISSLYR